MKSEGDVAAALAEVTKRHYGARHHPYAYRLVGGAEKASDDGEPSGSSGAPILELLRGRGLFDVLCVVSRYFGGTLLGVGGLQRAYAAAAAEALASCETVAYTACVAVELAVDYPLYSALQRLLSALPHRVIRSDFGAGVALAVALPAGEAGAFRAAFLELTRGAGKIELGERLFMAL